MVLEPWITPSLFYQFLGVQEPTKIAMDSFSFCTALGPTEANRQLRLHWKTWVTEDIIANLAANAVDTIRLPVGDWMFKPYYPFIGCWDGSLEEVQRVLDLCRQYRIQVVLDVHGVRWSQNGLDNSGQTENLHWDTPAATSNISAGDRGTVAKFNHWNIRGGDWVGTYDTDSKKYNVINESHIHFSLGVVEEVVQKYRLEPAVVGFTPVNEPSEHIDLDVIKQFYWDTYNIVQSKAPHWVCLFHDSFRLSLDNFGTFMLNCPNYAIDVHIYQAWSWANSAEYFRKTACESDFHTAMALEAVGVPIVVGEWSLATDNCAMWLNGFQDNIDGYPKVECAMKLCPNPYQGTGMQPGAPPDPRLGPEHGPRGSGQSFVQYGYCPVDKPFDNDLVETKKMAFSKLNRFDLHSHGQLFWNFRTELEDKWDYQRAVELGWLPAAYTSEVLQEVASACDDMHSEAKKEGLKDVPVSNQNYLLRVLLSLLPIVLVVFLVLRHFGCSSKRFAYVPIPTSISEGSVELVC